MLDDRGPVRMVAAALLVLASCGGAEASEISGEVAEMESNGLAAATARAAATQAVAPVPLPPAPEPAPAPGGPEGLPDAGDESAAAAVPARAARPIPTAVVLATAADVDFVNGLAVAGGSVYFSGGRTVASEPGAGGPPQRMVGVLRRVSATGGAVEDVWTGAGGGDDVAVGTQAVYFLTYDFYDRLGHLYRLPNTGTGADAAELATWQSHGSSQSLVVDGDVAFWTHNLGAGGTVKRTSGADGTTQVLAGGEFGTADDIVMDGSTLYFTESGTRVMGVPAAGGATFTAWIAPTANDGRVVRIEALAAMPWSTSTLFAGTDAGVSGTLVSINTRAQRGREVLTGIGPVAATVADASFVYVATKESERGPGELLRVSRHGGGRGAAVLATGLVQPTTLAVDGSAVYWVDTGTRTVTKVAKHGY